MKGIGKRLKQLRKQHSLTQRQIAEFLEISQSQYAKVESGDRNLKLTKLTKLCDLYNVPEEYIVYGEGKPNEDTLVFKGSKGLDLKTLARMNKIIKNLDEMRELYENQNNEAKEEEDME
jgi:transcriptional regulator with XRE-family HTH domain